MSEKRKKEGRQECQGASMELLDFKYKKKVYKEWKEKLVTWEDCKVVRAARDQARKPKT